MNHKSSLASLLLLAVAAPSRSAAVFERGWKTSRDGLLTLDSVSNRERLDLTESLWFALKKNVSLSCPVVMGAIDDRQ